MSTSGTVGVTSIPTIKVIEHAIRRCGLSTSALGSEQLEIAKDNLYLILLALANKGLNLWCVETNYVGLTPGKATYEMPIGTIDVLSMILSRPSRITGSDVKAGLNFTTDLSNAANIIRIGVKFNSIASAETVTVRYSSDDVTYSTAETITKTDWQSDEWYWISLDPIVSARYVRISTIAAIDVSDFYLATSVYDFELSSLNRDEYMSMPNKQTQSETPVNYYYERKLTPNVTLWPVPSDEHTHLTIVRHREVQDIGRLAQEIEIPKRWMEAVIWQLAERLCFEINGVEMARVPMIQMQSAKMLAEAEMEETDGTNIRFDVQIGGYMR